MPVIITMVKCFLSRLSVPDSCCVYDVVGCGRGILGIEAHQASMKVHSVGCLEGVTLYMRENITALVGLIVATLFIQVSSCSQLSVYLFILFIAVPGLCLLLLPGKLNKERM